MAKALTRATEDMTSQLLTISIPEWRTYLNENASQKLFLKFSIIILPDSEDAFKNKDTKIIPTISVLHLK